MRRFVFSAAIAAIFSPACAQQVDFERAFEILSKGQVVSSAPAATGSGIRTHEVFVVLEGRLYLCVLTGSTTSGTEPWPACYGKP